MNKFSEQIVLFFKTNHKEKIIALLITFIVWGIVVSKQRKTVVFDIPITVSIDKKYIFVEPPPKTIHVKTVGSPFNFAMIDHKKLNIKFSLKNQKEGQFKLFLDNSHFPFLSSVKISSIFPEKIRIKTALKKEKLVSIEPYLDGQPAEGFKIEKVEITPKKIKISGPKEVVDGLDSISTQKISLEGKTKTFTKEVLLFTDTPTISIKNDKKSATVVVKIGKDVRRMFFKKISLVVEGNINAVVKPSSINVLLEGPIEKLEKIKERGFTVFVKNKKAKRYYVNKFYFKDLPEDVVPVKFSNIKSIFVNKINK